MREPVTAVARPSVLAAVAPENESWAELLASLGLTGMAESLARNLSLEVEEEGRLCFHYTPEQEALLSGDRRERIIDALRQVRGAQCEIEFRQAPQTRETPAQRAERKRAERLADAVVSIETDATVKTLMDQFGARIEYESVRPID
jgi:DNA polymerase-3 subunit gamma/tau